MAVDPGCSDSCMFSAYIGIYKIIKLKIGQVSRLLAEYARLKMFKFYTNFIDKF